MCAKVVQEGSEAEESKSRIGTPDFTNVRTARPSIYWGYFYLFLLRYNDSETRFKLQRALKYTLVSISISALFVVTIIIHLPNTNADEATVKNTTFISRNTINNGCAFLENPMDPPNLRCTGLDLTNGSEPLLNELQRFYEQGYKKVDLTLINIKYRNNKIESGWLPLTDMHPVIYSLNIDGPSLLDIGERSLSGITKLEKLALSNTGVKYIAKQAFQGLSQVWDFTLRNNQDLRRVDPGLLQAFSLTSFLLEGMVLTEKGFSEQFFRNLTDNMDITTIEILQFQTNHIKTFQKVFIQNFPNVVSLFLSRNEITDFEPNAFGSLKKVKQVFLSTNDIETFPEEIFWPLIEDVNSALFIENNPLVCDCRMEWLQNITKRHNVSGDIEKVTCRKPEEFSNQLFIEVELCKVPETPINDTQLTSTTTEETSPHQEIPCHDEQRRNQIFVKPPLIQVTNSPKPPKINITEIDGASENIQLTFLPKEKPVALAYICQDGRSDDCTQIYCVKVKTEQRTITIKDLSPATDYIFCLLKENDTTTETVSFENCVAYKTLPTMSNRAWLTNAQKSMTLTYIILMTIGVFFLGACVAFCIVRKKPTLLRGSGRVEVVKSRDGELVLVMPENRDAPPPTPTSVYDTISGYITVAPTFANGKGSPPPLPPFPPSWMRTSKEEHEYLEPNRYLTERYPRNMDLLLEYEWYTSQQYRLENRVNE